MMKPEVSVVVPLYNEEQVFSQLKERLNKLADSLPFTLEFVLVDDGSKDSTASLMQLTALEDERYKAVFLSRNYGHQIAVTAGMSLVSATHAVMIIDGDLQDPPELLQPFYQKIREDGYDVIFAIRKKRKETWIKKTLYWAFYRILNGISEIRIPLDSGDFCMMTRRVNDVIVAMPEQSRYVRGMRTWVGFKQYGYEYEREMRMAGETKYTFRELLRLAYNGIFNFSELPIKLMTILGICSIFIGLLYLTYSFYRKIAYGDVPNGFSGLLAAIILFGGVQLVSVGVLGEYIIRIFYQTKERPLFIVKEIISEKEYKNL